MNTKVKRSLYWTPRALSILFALFISIFALDVFNEGYGFWESILALLIHLIPTYIVIIVLAIAWRREWIGAIVFIGLGLFYVVSSWGQFHWSTYLLIPSPLVLIGVLFWFNWKYKEELGKL